jgi:hypothetical protein
MKTRCWLAFASAALTLLCGCSSIYYGTMEKFGYEKRDILVKRVGKAREAQADTQKTFKNALEQFGSVVAYDGGDLQSQYDKMSAQLERCEARAEEVKTSIDAIERVSEDLFREWAQEIRQYANPAFKRDSEAKLRETRRNYDGMLLAMRNAEAQIQPVLVVFRDQTLYLKHNLNAKALAALQGETRKVETNVNALLADLSAAIAEADKFIGTMK